MVIFVYVVCCAVVEIISERKKFGFKLPLNKKGGVFGIKWLGEVSSFY